MRTIDRCLKAYILAKRKGYSPWRFQLTHADRVAVNEEILDMVGRHMPEGEVLYRGLIGDELAPGWWSESRIYDVPMMASPERSYLVALCTDPVMHKPPSIDIYLEDIHDDRRPP